MSETKQTSVQDNLGHSTTTDVSTYGLDAFRQGIQKEKSDQTSFDEFQYLETDSATASKKIDEFNDAVRTQITQGKEFKSTLKSLQRLAVDDNFTVLDARGEVLALLVKNELNPRGLIEFYPLEDFQLRKRDAKPFATLSLDEISVEEKKDWLLNQISPLQISKDGKSALIPLSNSGQDVAEVRELDLQNGKFKSNGFSASGLGGAMYHEGGPEVIFSIASPGARTTDAGFPAEVKIWSPGNTLENSRVVHEIPSSKLAIGLDQVAQSDGKSVTLFWNYRDYYNQELYLYRADSPESLRLPDISYEEYRGVTDDGYLLFSPKLRFDIDGANAKDGLVALDLEGYKKGETNFYLVYKPEKGAPVTGIAAKNGEVAISMLDNVDAKIVTVPFSREGIESNGRGEPIVTEVAIPRHATISDMKTLPGLGVTFTMEGFVNSKGFYSLGNGGGIDWKDALVSNPNPIDPKDFEVSQKLATSRDGTKIPYYEISKKGEPRRGAPTIIYSYGGFSENTTPFNIWPMASEWIAKGGSYAVASVRGGSEFGEKWHEDGMGEKRINSFQDLIAVAENISKESGVPSSKIGIVGGSHGGLTVAGAMVADPAAFGAVVAEVPILDLEHYVDIDPKASMWIGEYGDPADESSRALLRKDSPYANLTPGESYPPMLLMAAKFDDRGGNSIHALKMAVKMKSQSHDVMLYTADEGGHSNSSQKQAIYEKALMITFFRNTLSNDHHKD